MNDLTGAKILITGGAGFVGSLTAEQLLSEGVKEIVILDNLIRGSVKNIAGIMDSGKIRFIEGDIRDSRLVDGLLRDIDYCFHLAALRITHCIESPRDAVEVMIDGTFNVAEACVKHKVKKIVAASSASIYGNANTFPTKEDHHPYNNRTLYGAAKVANELILRSFCSMYGLAYDMLRYFNVYGPRMDIHGRYTEVLIRWYDAIRAGREPLIYGDGKQTMDFIYIEDVARSNILAMKADVKDEVFNIASGTETSLEELCFLLLEVMKTELRPKYVPISDDRKKVEVGRRLADTGKAEERIGFRSKVSLREGLGSLVAWLDGQRAGVKP
jgi:UDP-glucose 4-epimerase